MLYGYDEDEEENAHYNHENLKEKNDLVIVDQFNIKKILIIVAIVIGALIVIFSGLKITSVIYNKQNGLEYREGVLVQDVQKEQEEQNNQEENNGEDEDIDDTIYDPNKAGSFGLSTFDPTPDEDTKVIHPSNIHKDLPLHKVEDFVFYKLPVANENAKQEIKNIYYSDEKQVYLTFDDGPTKAITPQILDILKQYNVPATFFVLGSRVDLNPGLVKREFEEGHYIANHGFTHKYSQIYANPDSTFQEFVDCENSIKNALGMQDYNSYLFRFPGGSTGGKYASVKADARNLFDSYGVAYTNWNCLTGDAENKDTKEKCINEMIRTMDDQKSIILLMHDAADKTQTVEALPEIIEYFQNEGYTFKNFYEIFK